MNDASRNEMMPHQRRVCWGPVVCVVTGLLALSCSGDPTARVEGRLAAACAETAQTSQPLTAEAGNAAYRVAHQALTDSAETSLTGLSVELVLVNEGPAPDYVTTDVETIDTVVPDEAGRFVFAEVPVQEISGDELEDGVVAQYYHVRIDQEPGALIEYGAYGILGGVEEGETLLLSLPLVTRILLPLWPEPDPDLTEWDSAVELAADNENGTVIYFNPDLGIGIYNPSTSIVDTLRMESLLDYHCGDLGCAENEMLFLEETGQVLLARYHPQIESPSRYILVDLDIFTDDAVSEALDLDDADTAQALEGRVTVMDVPVQDSLACEPVLHDFYHGALRPTPVVTADRSRLFWALANRVDVFDLEERAFVETWWCDGAILGGYNAHSGHLYLDITNGDSANPRATLRVVEADTGELVNDLDLGAQYLIGLAVVDFSDYPRAIVSYVANTDPIQHRIAVIGTDGTVESDHLGGEYLGFLDRYFDEAYDWGGCTQEWCDVIDSSPLGECPPIDIFPTLDMLQNVQNTSMFFDPVNDQLVTNEWVFQLRDDDLFYPTPHFFCGHFGIPWMCKIGQKYYDPFRRVALSRRNNDSRITCIIYLDASDLAVPVELDAAPGELEDFITHSSLGVGLLATINSLTVIHFRNPDAVTMPAVRDLR
ncbi:MAG: hypothetical protein JW797_04260 [Bradymonadales bacterium]|nr:hypothetical protein [Bradymonadales bacterium]